MNSTSSWIVPSRSSRCMDAKLVGGKARELSWLSRHGFEVPAWFAISTAAFVEFVSQNGLQKLISETSSECEAGRLSPNAASGIIAEGFSRSSLPRSLTRELTEVLAPFETHEFAVRSSVADEDGEKHSFAGQMDSFLFQRGQAEIEASVIRCYLSAFSPRAMQYRLLQNISLQTISTAVVIQTMIDGEVSGVLFTADPLSGNRKKALISANYGSCEGVVSGSCDCDEFLVQAETGEITAKIRPKNQQISRGVSGTAQTEVPAAIAGLPCLSDAQVRRLTVLGSQIAGLKGTPQDIEWTIQKDRIYALQCRPITKLPPQSEGSRTVFDNSNIQESYCGLTLPLTFSFANRNYFEVYRQMMREMGCAEEELLQHDRRHQQMLGLIHGRVYYNINNWYRGLLLLPSFGRNKGDMEKMMGLTEPVDFIEDERLNLKQKAKRLPKMIKVAAHLMFAFARIDSLVKRFEVTFSEAYARVDRSRFQFLNGRELADLAEEIRERFLSKWGVPIINDFYVMMQNGKVLRKLESLGLENELMNLLSGEELASTLPTKELMALADEVKASRTLRSLFEMHPDDDVLEAALLLDPGFHGKCLQFIENYGDRCIGELKLESISLRENSSFMFQVLRSYLKKSNLNVTSIRKKSEELVFSKITGSFSRFLFRSNIRKLRKAIRYRESTRLARTRVFGLFRSLYLEIGSRLKESGAIQNSRDVFYLTTDEIDRYYAGTSVQVELLPLIELRKAEYQRYLHDDPGHRVVVGSEVYEENSWQKPLVPSFDKQQVYQGTGCFPGVVHKPVRLIHSSNETKDLEGRILCTVRTDPGWTPLFATISGLIVERGSALSHSAVVARELGIPAIVGVPSITALLSDNEMIQMDGAAGTVFRSEDFSSL